MSSDSKNNQTSLLSCMCPSVYNMSVCPMLSVALPVWVPEITHWQINGLSWPSSLLHAALCGWPAHSSNTACVWGYRPNRGLFWFLHTHTKHIKSHIKLNLDFFFLVSFSRIFSYLDVVTLCRCAQVSKVSIALSTPPNHPLPTNTVKGFM